MCEQFGLGNVRTTATVSKQTYLTGCRDDTLSVGVTLQGLCELAEQEDTHLNSIQLLFPVLGRETGGEEEGGQGDRQATHHCRMGERI